MTLLFTVIFLSAVMLVLVSPGFHDAHFGVAKNESTAVSSLLVINTLEKAYASTVHTGGGFSCQLPLLRPVAKIRDAYDPIGSLLAGTRSGYRFALVGCGAGANGIASHYELTAVPVKPGTTGIRAFCTDQSGQVFYDLHSSASQCLALRQSLDLPPGLDHAAISVKP